MEKQYDVCLSFAGEQRNYVKKVYDELVKNHIRVFYDQDKDIETYLWGKNLYEAFKEIYKTKASYCIMFVSKEYAQKTWTRHEKRSAFSIAYTESEEYILPVRFDSTEIPGLDDATCYLDANVKSPYDIAESIIRKLGHDPINNSYTLEEAIGDLAEELESKVNLTQSKMVIIKTNTGIKIFKNCNDAAQEIYGAFIYCTRLVPEPEYDVININIFHTNLTKVKQHDILDGIDEVLYNEQQNILP